VFGGLMRFGFMYFFMTGGSRLPFAKLEWVFVDDGPACLALGDCGPPSDRPDNMDASGCAMAKGRSAAAVCFGSALIGDVDRDDIGGGFASYGQESVLS
jgi:hypothetical protein